MYINTLPLVSIIIITYNSQSYIRRAIVSVLRQTYKNLEIIVIDAGSIDNTANIVLEFSNVRFYILKESSMGEARNYGSSLANGIYISFLDSDDFYCKQKIELQVHYLLNNPLIDIVFSNFYFYKNTNPHLRAVSNCSNNFSNYFINGYNYNLNTMLIKKYILNDIVKFGEGDKGRYGEDWRFQIECCIKRIPMALIKLPLVYNENRVGSHTSWNIQSKMKEMAYFDIIKYINNNYFNHIPNKLKSKIIFKFKLKLYISCIVSRDIKRIKILLINNNTHKIFITLIIFLLNFIPIKIIKYLWLCKQKYKYNWNDNKNNSIEFYDLFCQSDQDKLIS